MEILLMGWIEPETRYWAHVLLARDINIHHEIIIAKETKLESTEKERGIVITCLPPEMRLDIILMHQHSKIPISQEKRIWPSLHKHHKKVYVKTNHQKARIHCKHGK